MIEKIGPTIYKGNSIYNIGSGGGGNDPIIPAGFIRVGAVYYNSTNAYSSDGFRIINGTNKGKIQYTLYKPNNNKQNQWNYLFILGDWDNKDIGIAIRNYPSTSLSIYNGGSAFNPSYEIINSGLYEFTFDKDKLKINNNNYSNVDYVEKNAITKCFPFPIDQDRRKTDPIFAMRELKIIDDTNKITSWIVGVKRVYDSSIGILDTITGYYYLSSYFTYYNI